MEQDKGFYMPSTVQCTLVKTPREAVLNVILQCVLP